MPRRKNCKPNPRSVSPRLGRERRLLGIVQRVLVAVAVADVGLAGLPVEVAAGRRRKNGARAQGEMRLLVSTSSSPSPSSLPPPSSDRDCNCSSFLASPLSSFTSFPISVRTDSSETYASVWNIQFSSSRSGKSSCACAPRDSLRFSAAYMVAEACRWGG